MVAPRSTLGRYELLRRLDGGGMGEVFLARAQGPAQVQKTVVLKRLRADRAADESSRARFVDEARIAVSLSHPHIVPVFEFGERDGEYFLVMEWLRGGNLQRVAGARKPPLGWAATALIGSQICDALAYVHARRNRQGAALVHGDVTPRNVLLSTDGHVLLADFGLARFAARGRAGTLRYQAPEQARGESIDARADLYALALVLSEVATGHAVYDADPSVAARQALTGVMPDLTGVDAELAQLLRRSLAAQPAGRPRDAIALREALEALLDRELHARKVGRAELIARTAEGGPTTAPGSRSEASTMATRDATRVPVSRRWAAIALAALVAAAVAMLVRARPPVAPPPVVATRPPIEAEPPPAAPHAETAVEPAAPRAHKSRHLRPTAAPAEQPTGLLDVNALPWARVRIDGQSRGETPILHLAIPAGTHRIELVNEPLGARRELVVRLAPGEHLQRIVDLNAAATP